MHTPVHGILNLLLRLQIDTFVNPLRSSMRNMSNAVKAFPDSLAEGMNKVTDNMGRMSERLGQDLKQSILKVKGRHTNAHLPAFRHSSPSAHRLPPSTGAPTPPQVRHRP